MHHSASRGMRHRRSRRRSIFSGLTSFTSAGARGSPTLRFCTGFLLLSSVVICHVTIVRYVEERLRPPEATDDASGGLLPGEEVDRRRIVDGVGEEEEEATWNRRRLMSEAKAEPGQDDRRPDSQHPTDISAAGSSRPGSGPCRDRHIQGLSSAVCAHLPCLRSLQVPSGDLPSPQPTSQIPPDVLRRLNRIPGSLDPVHYTLLPFLADMQRSNGVRGSVGQLGGVHVGQLAALLGLTIDRKSGERLFVSDPFNSSSTSTQLPGLSQIEIFRSHLHDFDFDTAPSAPPKVRVFVHRGPPSSALADVLLQWDLPRFRMISVEASRDPLDGLELAACLLRDGGIVILDQPTSMEAAVDAVAAFQRRHGRSAISPIFAAGGKLFLTTTNWKTVYADHFRRKETELAHLSVVDDGNHGNEMFVVR